MTTLGKYELHEEIGRGGFATVYRVTLALTLQPLTADARNSNSV